MKELKYVITILEDIINENNVTFNACTEKELTTNSEYSKLYKKFWFSNMRMLDAVKMLKLFCDEKK